MEKMKFNIENLKKNSKPIINWLGFVSIIIIVFYIGMFFTTFKTAINPKNGDTYTEFMKPSNLENCSVSVTDRGELLIIDRNTGTFTVYNDDVGMSIFRSYAKHITNTPK